ncbi:MAG: Crp/Fnr family transcriptional regulator [Hyphomicrobiaceae bacterium]
MSDHQNLAEAMEATELFGNLDMPTRLLIVKEMRPVAFTAGQSIFSRGDAGKELYYVTNGLVRLSILTAEGRELAFTHAGAGSIFGEIAMLDGKARTADATAVTKTEAMTLGQAALDRLLESSWTFAKGLLRFMCARLREADLQLEGVALHRIEVRLARFLLGRCQQHSDGEDADGLVTVSLGMSQGELALLLGASRPKVNAALTLLEDQGTIRRDGSKIRCDFEDLKCLAEMD